MKAVKIKILKNQFSLFIILHDELPSNVASVLTIDFCLLSDLFRFEPLEGQHFSFHGKTISEPPRYENIQHDTFTNKFTG